MTETFLRQLKISQERIAVLIGEKGQTKRVIEKETQTRLDIDSKEGDVTISGEDGLSILTAENIVKAIARGFNPKVALQLLKIDYTLESFNLNDYAKTKNDMIRLRGRVIGEGGKSRKTIEDLTGCSICVFGKTITLIGAIDAIALARRAVDMLLQGSAHRNVYKFLESQQHQIGRGFIN